jgi:hypothetical protein
MKQYLYQDDLAPDEIFVFGSNLAGIHGAGAARTAALSFGAVHGKGVGLNGRSYAIPTKDHNIATLPLYAIREFVELFLAYASAKPELKFIVTPIGCGLAGYTPADIAPMFQGHPSNVILPPEFLHENLRRP